MVYFPQGAIRIYPETVTQGIADGVDRVITRQDNLEKQIARETLPSKYWPSVYDDERGVHLRTDTWGPFIRWRMASEEDHAIEYVKAPESVGIMMPAADVYNASSRKLTKLPHAITELNMRDVGLYVSLEHNFRWHLIDYMKSDEGQQLAVFLNKLGYKIEDVDYIAIGFTRERAIYAVGKLPNGKVVIYAHKDSYKKITDWAEREGIRPEELREAAIGEEITHLFRSFRPSIIKGRITEEKATKKALLEFYENLAKTTSNPELKAKYATIIEHLKYDIATVSRYARINSNSLQDLVDLYCTDVGELEQVLEAEALYNGVNTEKGIKEYVSARLEEIAEAADEEYSGKDDVTEVDAEMSEYAEGESVDGEVAEGEVCAEAETDGGDAGGEGGQ